MNIAGRNAGVAGHGPWAPAASATLNGNPRKFSEKIALHTQRQAEDTAAFQEVMMDITSTRIQAQRLRQAKGLASCYGSLPNVNQISKCSTESQREHLRADHGLRSHRPIPPGRPVRRHTENAPYLSFHLSPPSGPSWRRQWSNRSVNGKSQVDQLPVTTLSRTNSDSALHTSVRITYMKDSHPAQVMTAYSRQSGTPLFRHPVPLIEETVQESQIKSQKSPSGLSGCGTPVNCGSLPDLSSLHLPSAVPEAIDPEPGSHTSSFGSPISMHHLPNPASHTTIRTDNDFLLPSLSTSLQASSIPSLQSSLSNPNLQATLSSHSLVESLSSASLSLSNSSLQSALSSQSLRSSLSSSSLSNHSVRSAASHCSYSSGIGGSSSSSLSCSPHASGQGTVPRSSSPWMKSHLNPLIVPSGGESFWLQQKQLSPNLSPTFVSVNEGVPVDNTKVQQEVRPSRSHSSHLSPTGYPMAYQSMQHYQPESWEQSRRDTKSHYQQQALQQSASQLKSQPQYFQHSPSKAQQNILNTRHYVPQQQLHEQKQSVHQYQHAQFHQQSLHQQCLHTQQYIQHQTPHCQSQQHTQALQHQTQELTQYGIPQLQPSHIQHNQGQIHPGAPGSFQEQQPCSLSTGMKNEGSCWQNQVKQHSLPSTGVQRPLKACMQIKELSKLQTKIPLHDLRRERTTHYPKVVHSQRDHVQLDDLASTLDKDCGLHNESYAGLHLTPSQTEALSQKLGQLHKEPADVMRISDSKYLDVKEKDGSIVENFGDSQTQIVSTENLHIFPDTDIPVPCAWLEDELSDLPDTIPEFDLEPFALVDLKEGTSEEDFSYMLK
ncbi:CREB-regulated transcription coactivator 2 [Hoplias malabaricus]|uniref:CREB-regulated transcription coactivator 2 n=1 Tax=Hoplias malabaricus TaxID=27720 RepID=UPI003462B73F